MTLGNMRERDERRENMNLITGIALLALFGAMIWLGKPKAEVEPFFMRNWFVGNLYIGLCLVVFVLGVVSIILSLAPRISAAREHDRQGVAMSPVGLAILLMRSLLSLLLS